MLRKYDECVKEFIDTWIEIYCKRTLKNLDNVYILNNGGLQDNEK